jgi:ubiquitin-conjugating enzyme E2 A
LVDIYIEIDKKNLTQWQGLIFGPDDTEWEGGVFHLAIELKETYPNEAPKIKFIHPKRMFHPNVYQNGEICLDILQKGWTPAYNLLSALKSIQVSTHPCVSFLLTSPRFSLC